ncbi:MAG: hypothetical protein OXK79_08020 [Chloroflexota bacterium]|nr:hypothetical protein [Chloroflexota bacterium]
MKRASRGGRVESLRRQARIILLLHGAANAGLCPISILALHAYAYLSNVLAPVWDMPVLDGKILKRKGGPFYPALQGDLDRLVGVGLVRISHVTHVQDSEGRWRLEGRYELHASMAAAALAFLLDQPDEARVAGFVEELGYALSVLSAAQLDRALVDDATYGNPEVSTNNVLDFGEWSRRNPSSAAANFFDELLTEGAKTTPGEKLHLYVSHLRRRFAAG